MYSDEIGILCVFVNSSNTFNTQTRYRLLIREIAAASNTYTDTFKYGTSIGLFLGKVIRPPPVVVIPFCFTISIMEVRPHIIIIIVRHIESLQGWRGLNPVAAASLLWPRNLVEVEFDIELLPHMVCCQNMRTDSLGLEHLAGRAAAAADGGEAAATKDNALIHPRGKRQRREK